MRYILPILLVLSICISSCNDPDDNTIVSSDARVSTFTFQPDTANPGLTTAVYKIEHRTDTGLITSKDSLRYGTRLDSVVPLVTYMATPGIVNFVLPDTTITSTGIDTINFNQKPIYLQVIASDMETEKWYLIDIAATNSQGVLTWTGLEEDVYVVAELQAPEHYNMDNTPILAEAARKAPTALSTQATCAKRTEA